MRQLSDTYRSGARPSPLRGPLRVLLALASGLAITMTATAPAQAGSAPVLSWTPATGTATYDYGTIDTGTESVQTFTLRNSGRAGTSALKITLTGSDAYTITGNTCSGTSLGPKKTCTVTVEYAPTTAGQTDTATLTATSNKPAARAVLALTGSSTAAQSARSLQQYFEVYAPHPWFCHIRLVGFGFAPNTTYATSSAFTGFHNGETAVRSVTTDDNGAFDQILFATPVENADGPFSSYVQTTVDGVATDVQLVTC